MFENDGKWKNAYLVTKQVSGVNNVDGGRRENNETGAFAKKKKKKAALKKYNDIYALV